VNIGEFRDRLGEDGPDPSPECRYCGTSPPKRAKEAVSLREPRYDIVLCGGRLMLKLNLPQKLCAQRQPAKHVDAACRKANSCKTTSCLCRLASSAKKRSKHDHGFVRQSFQRGGVAPAPEVVDDLSAAHRD